jgi:O-antigen ligase
VRELWYERALTIVLGLFICSALYRGGNVGSIATLGVWLAIFAGILVALGQFAGFHDGVPSGSFGVAHSAFLLALATVALFGVAGLLSISANSFVALPGRSYYLPAIEFSGTLGLDQRFRVSLDPHSTIRATGIAVASLMIALVVRQLSRTNLMIVMGLYAVLVVVQSVIGLLQLGLAAPSFLSYDAAIGTRRAVGTFVNKNHFATFIAMGLPLLLMRSAGCFTFFTDATKHTRLKRAWWGFATALAAAALISSVSRAGVAAGFTVALLTIAICAWTTRARNQRLAFLAIGAMALLVASFAGVELMLASVADGGFERGVESRALLNDMTWSGVKAFFPYGAGLGSFAIAFPRFQLEKFPGFVEHAHNDYLQLLFELGIVGAFALLCLFVAGAAQAWRLFGARKEVSLANPATACLLGVLAFAIHAWFDFPAHIPSVVWTASLLFAASTHSELARRSKSTSTRSI